MLLSVFDLFPQLAAWIELTQHAQDGLGIARALVHSLLEIQGGSNTVCNAGRGQRSLFTGWNSLAAAP